jgi:hypothetical protein
MNKPYQIEAQRAVKQSEAMAADGNPAMQMMLPMAEMVGWLRKGVGELIRQAGLQLMELLMQEEVRELAGERSQQQPERTASRWGSERGYCVVMGQKVPIQRPTAVRRVITGLYHAGATAFEEDHKRRRSAGDGGLRLVRWRLKKVARQRGRSGPDAGMLGRVKIPW